MTLESSRWCDYCGKQRLARRRELSFQDTMGHTLLIFLTCGCWFPIYLVFALWGPDRPWLCSRCGGRV